MGKNKRGGEPDNAARLLMRSRAASFRSATLVRLMCAAAVASATAVSATPSRAAQGQDTAPRPPSPPTSSSLPHVEDVIPDREIETAVPPLAPQPGEQVQAPLESLSTFQREIEATSDVSGVAPAADPELNQPLPPLNQFDVRPVELAEPAPEGSKTELRYSTSVEGLQTADALSAADLSAQFDDLSALKEGGGKAANEAMLRARLAQDADLLQSILESQGWYSATVHTRIERPSDGSDTPLVAVLQVAPGDRYSLGSIRVTAHPTVPSNLIEDNLPLKVGDPIVAEQIMGAEAALAVALPENGYPFAELGQRDILLDRDTDLGDYVLPVDLGPRSRFGGFETTGDLAFGAEHVKTIARFKRGQIYDSQMVDDLRQALIATGLFNAVSVEPKRTGVAAPGDTEYVTMLVTQDAGPPRTIAASAGYETGKGILAQASWTHRNLFPPEGALIVSGVAGTDEQGASVTFRRSNAGKRDRTFQMIAEARRSTYDAFDALTGRIAARLSYDSTPIWRKPLTWAVGAELIGTVESDYDFSAGERRKRKFLIAGVNGEVGIDRSDSLLDPTKGFKAKLLLQPEAAVSDAFRPYLRGQVDASAYHPFGDSVVLAGRVRAGSTLGIDRFDLAPSRRFYAGGGGSVRGFGYQQLGPRDPNGDPLGGLSVVEGAAEVRYRFGDYGVVAFADAGQVYTQRIPTFSDIRVGVGVGVRYYTNFGPVRVDVATPVNRRPGESRFNIYVSIGQAF